MMKLMPWKRNDSRRADDSGMVPVSQMRWDWDRLFDRLLDDAWSQAARPVPDLLLDLSETDDEIRVRVEVPGIEPDDLDISLSGDVLTLAGEKVDEDDSRDGSLTYSERRIGSFYRALKLPCEVDPDHVLAQHRNGVVTITLQKAETVRPKRIRIKSA